VHVLPDEHELQLDRTAVQDWHEPELRKKVELVQAVHVEAEEH
jgi:hypothetical protein